MALYIVPITSKDQQGYIAWIAVACGGRKDLWHLPEGPPSQGGPTQRLGT